LIKDRLETEISSQFLVPASHKKTNWLKHQKRKFPVKFPVNFIKKENPPSQNERLSKGYRNADIKASADASHKKHVCISLKQRGYSRNYGLVCNLGKQMAEKQSV